MRLRSLALTTLVPLMASAQNQPPQDEFLREYAQTRRYLNGRPGGFKFTPDGKTLLLRA